jgi:hypothetical protein
LPPSPAFDEDESTVVSEFPAKPQRTYAWSLDEEIKKVSESSVSDKPRRPTIIRPSKLNKNVSMEKEHPSSQVEESISSSPEKGSLPLVPVWNFEKSIEINAKKNENVEVMPEKSVHNSENIRIFLLSLTIFSSVLSLISIRFSSVTFACGLSFGLGNTEGFGLAATGGFFFSETFSAVVISFLIFSLL